MSNKYIIPVRRWDKITDTEDFIYPSFDDHDDDDEGKEKDPRRDLNPQPPD